MKCSVKEVLDSFDPSLKEKIACLNAQEKYYVARRIGIYENKNNNSPINDSQFEFDFTKRQR